MGEIAIEPHEKRIRRITWLVLLASVVALIAGGAIAWSVGGRMQMEAAIDATHARGWRATKSDFKPPAPIPDDQNAAFYLDRAGKAFKPSEQYKDAEKNLQMDRLPLSDREQQIISVAVDANPSVFADVRHARSLPRAVWNVPFNAIWNLNLRVREYGEQRQLAKLVANSAFLHHQRGQDAEAVAELRDVLRMGRPDDSVLPTIVSHLVVTGIEAIAVDHARQIAPDLSSAGAAEARAMIPELLDEREYPQGWSNAVEGERALLIESTKPLRGKFLVGPHFARGLARNLGRMIQLADAATKPTLPAAKATLPGMGSNPGLLELSWPSLIRALGTQYKCLADRRATAIILALRLYQLDNRGLLPARLDALVPDYLPAVPLDPLASGSRPFGYSGPTSDPYIYSAGDDGKDNSASTRRVYENADGMRHVITRPERSGEPFWIWDREDAVFYFYRRPKPPPLNPPE